jgi:hypothetical protein
MTFFSQNNNNIISNKRGKIIIYPKSILDNNR